MTDEEDIDSTPPLPALIPNSRLRLEDLPAPDADDEAVYRFALTFNGYRNYRSFERSAALYKRGSGSTLSTHRNWLFFRTREIYHSWGGANEEDFLLMREVIEEIRVLLAERERRRQGSRP